MNKLMKFKNKLMPKTKPIALRKKKSKRKNNPQKVRTPELNN